MNIVVIGNGTVEDAAVHVAVERRLGADVAAFLRDGRAQREPALEVVFRCLAQPHVTHLDHSGGG